MRHVCGNELRKFMYSPIAWVVIVVYIVQTSFIVVSRLQAVLNDRTVGRNEFSSATLEVFSELGVGLIAVVQSDLLFYLPLLTMGIIVGERTSGAISLLYSSPIRLSALIVGKYAALIVIIGLFCTILLVQMIVVSQFVESFEFAIVLSGILGVFLLGSAYAAVGLFVSSLARYEIVAAIGTLAILFVIASIAQFGQRWLLLGDYFYWLSLVGRSENMQMGLIRSEDIAYFILLVCMFLCFTYLWMQKERVSRTVGQWTALWLSVITAIGLVGYASTLRFASSNIDVSRSQMLSLSKGSEASIAGLPHKYEVDLYANVLSSSVRAFLPTTERSIRDFLFDRFERAGVNVNFDSNYYYANTLNEPLFRRFPEESIDVIARTVARQYGLDMAEVLSPATLSNDFSIEAELGRPVLLIRREASVRIVRFFNDFSFFPNEGQIAAALSVLNHGAVSIGYVEESTPRRLLGGRAEDHNAFFTDITDRRALVNNGFDVFRVAGDIGSLQDADILILPGLSSALSTDTLRGVEQHIDNGKNLVILVEDGSQDELSDIFDYLGVSVTLESAQNFVNSGGVLEGFITEAAEDLSAHFMGWSENSAVRFEDGIGLVLNETGEFDVVRLLVGDSDEREHGHDTGPGALAWALRREVAGREQRILLVGDADVVSNGAIRSFDAGNNQTFAEVAFRWLSYGRFPVDISRPLPIDNHLRMDRAALSTYTKFFLLAYPASVGLVGGVLLMVRRRQRVDRAKAIRLG